MISDSSISRLQAYFRDLFLDELRADDGWAEYIDLLVHHLDLAGFDYLQAGGVPYYFRLSDFLGISGWDSKAVGSDSPCSITPMLNKGDGVYVTFNAPRTGSALQWLDFAAGVWVRVPRQKCVYMETSYVEGSNIEDHIRTQYFDIGGLWRPSVLRASASGDTLAPGDIASVLYNNGLQVSVLEADTSGVVWAPRVELTVYSNEGASSQPCMVILRLPRYIETPEGDPLEVAWSADADSALVRAFSAGIYPFTKPEGVVDEHGVTRYYIPVDWSQVGLQVDSIPHLVNGGMVRSARMGAGVGQSLYGVAPSARSLFSTMYGLGLDYRKFPFRFYLANGVSLGDYDIQYPGYVSIRGYLDPMRSVRDVYKDSGADVLPDRWPVVSWGYGEDVGDGSSVDVVGFVASERTPTDALRDRWGVDLKDGEFYSLVDGVGMNGALQELFVKYGGSSIFGYDKKLWVVINNGYGEAWYYLGSPYRRRGGVSIYGDWNGKVMWDVGGTVMTPAQFRLESDVEELHWRPIDNPAALASVLDTNVLEGTVGSEDFDVYTRGGSFIIGTPSNGGSSDVIPLCTELSHAFYLPEGLTKHYEDLSFQDSLVPVERLSVAFLGTKASFGEYLLGLGLISSLDELDAYLEWLRDVFGRSVPVGIEVDIIFVPLPSRVALELGVSGVPGMDTSAGSSVYLLSNPGEVHIQEGMDVLYPVVVRSNVGWWVDMDVKLVLGVRLSGETVWESSVDVDVTEGAVSVDVYAASSFGMNG